MSKFKQVFSVLGLSAPKIPPMPKAEIPAAPAPVRRTDTGASIVVGASDVKNQRVSGSRTAGSAGSTLSGLGRGAGLSI